MSAAARQPAHWGFHRLDERWAERLVAAAGIAPGDLVLDVGAGLGALTAPLVDAGAHVVAVDRHPRRVADLRRRFAGQPVTVVNADAADLRLPRRPFKVVANPPFAVTTALLRRLLHDGSRLQQAHLVVPRHVAARWLAGRGPGCARWDLHSGGRIPRHAFHPAPPDDASLLVVVRRR